MLDKFLDTHYSVPLTFAAALSLEAFIFWVEAFSVSTLPMALPLLLLLASLVLPASSSSLNA
jgi:hypothetical protein